MPKKHLEFVVFSIKPGLLPRRVCTFKSPNHEIAVQKYFGNFPILEYGEEHRVMLVGGIEHNLTTKDLEQAIGTKKCDIPPSWKSDAYHVPLAPAGSGPWSVEGDD